METLKVVDLYDETSESKKKKFSENTKSELNLEINQNKVENDFEWLDIMENTIVYLDNILRNPNRFIINEEEIVKVELARKITVESVRHLAKHTNFIQKIEDNGDVKPSKILNINKDESYDTYENRLIYTLIENMRNFIELKKKTLISDSNIKDIKKARYSGRTNIGNEQVVISLDYISSLNEKKNTINEGELAQRLQKLDDNILMLTTSDVYKTLSRLHVARVTPPIKKTNVILKNTNFQYAMKLWDYLQSHVANDSKVIKVNKNYQDTGLLKEYFDSTFLLNYLAVNTLSESEEAKVKQDMVEDITDKLVQKILDINPNVPLEELKDKIGDKMAVIRYKREASLSEINSIFSKYIKEYLDKIENMEL